MIWSVLQGIIIIITITMIIDNATYHQKFNNKFLSE